MRFYAFVFVLLLASVYGQESNEPEQTEPEVNQPEVAQPEAKTTTRQDKINRRKLNKLRRQGLAPDSPQFCRHFSREAYVFEKTADTCLESKPAEMVKVNLAETLCGEDDTTVIYVNLNELCKLMFLLLFFRATSRFAN